jgi:putative signal transducing protein
MQCPNCRADCGHESARCANCGASLVIAHPDANSSFDPGLDVIVVLATNNRIQLAMAKGLMEDAGIPFFVLGQIATLVQDVDPFLQKWVRLQVPRDREAEARELLENFANPENSSPVK